MKRISGVAYEWSRYDAYTQRDANGHFVQSAAGEPGVLVDPVPLNEGDEDQVRALGGAVGVVLTSGAHVRDAARCARAFGCPVFAPEPALAAVAAAGVADARGYAPGRELPGGLVAVPVSEGSWPGEAALYAPTGGGTLVVGHAMIGEPLGGLSLPPRADPEDGAAAARGLRALLGRRLGRVLVAHGQSVLRDPVPLIQELLFERDPEACLVRRGEARFGPAQLFGERFGSAAAEYSRVLGLKTIDFELTELPPGRQSFPLHRHDGEEELFLIIEGRGELEIERRGATRRIAIESGDVLAFPPRFQIAHAIRNTGGAPLRYFAFSAPAETLEMADYPTTGARLERTQYGKRRRFYLPERLDVPYFEGEPTNEAIR